MSENKAAYPFPQLLVTLVGTVCGRGGQHFLVEATDGEMRPKAVDARDIEALLATVGRWAFSARSQSEGNRHV